MVLGCWCINPRNGIQQLLISSTDKEKITPTKTNHNQLFCSFFLSMSQGKGEQKEDYKEI